MRVLTSMAAICGALTVVLIFIAAVARIRWVRWVWRHLVSDPLAIWLRGGVVDAVGPEIEKAVAPIRDNVASLATDLREHMRDEGDTIVATNEAVALTNARLTGIEERVEGLIDWLIPERAELRDDATPPS